MYGSNRRSNTNKSTKDKKPPTKKKGELTQRQKDTLKRHSKHHTKKHIALMTKLMKEGKTFGESHKIAIKRIGK
tara:strand:+ start:134 stop:355 length:222 start_codon:yes stop_codon:yes gene_type:complete